MKKVGLFLSLILIILLPHQAIGQIYTWVDENGVKHFGNDPPPPDAKIIQEAVEIPHDAARDDARQEADEKYFENIQQMQMNQESNIPPEERNQPPEGQPESETEEVQEGGSEAVSDSDQGREGVDSSDEQGTSADMAPPEKGDTEK